MQITADQKLLRLIKFAPVLVVVVFAVLFLTVVVQDNRAKARHEIETLRQDFIAQQKQLIQSQVDQVLQQIEHEKANTEALLKQTIQDRIREAHRIADSLYQRHQHKSEAEVTQLITDALRSIRFNDGRGYFFIYKTTGESVMHPLLPQMEGSNKLDLQDIRGNYIVRDMGALVKAQGEAFYRWWFVKPQNKQQEFEKIGFGKYFEPYDWFIGTGEYIVDVENDIQTRLLERINKIRFGDNGYIFTVDYDGNTLAHYRSDYLGTNRLSDQDSQGREYIRLIIDTAKHGDGYVSYVSPLMPSTGEAADKTSYIKGIPDWNWAVGAGVYLAEIESYLANREAQLREQNRVGLIKLLILSLLVIAVLLALSLWLSKTIGHRFNNFQRRIIHDFEELEETKDQMQHMALHDALTELPNRVLLSEQIQQGIELSARNNQQLAVMFVDLDDFKKVNDLYGHATGDRLLQAISQQFQQLIPPGDTVSRFGGDEFIFCCPELADINAAVQRVEQIKQVFQQAFNIDGKVIHSSCSIGVAMYPADSDNPEELITKADIVLYKSKARRKGDVLFFDKRINEQVQYDFTLEAELRQALTRNEFSLFYQPQIDIQSGQLHGVEALIRWHNQRLGQVPPLDFIGVAEDTGLIQPIGQFVIEQACCDIRDFNRINAEPIKLSINISPKQLMEPGFIDQLDGLIKRSDLPREQVILEITENVLINDLGAAQPLLQQLRDLGFGISLDDFGTGYSSLSYLNTLPINEIKIDRSFIDKLLSNLQSESLVKTIIAIGRSGRMRIVAEGVETQQQLDRLVELNCDIAQGYLLDRPLPIADLTERYGRAAQRA